MLVALWSRVPPSQDFRTVVTSLFARRVYVLIVLWVCVALIANGALTSLPLALCSTTLPATSTPRPTSSRMSAPTRPEHLPVHVAFPSRHRPSCALSLYPSNRVSRVQAAAWSRSHLPLQQACNHTPS